MLRNHLRGQLTISLLESSFIPTVAIRSRSIYRQPHNHRSLRPDLAAPLGSTPGRSLSAVHPTMAGIPTSQPGEIASGQLRQEIAT